MNTTNDRRPVPFGKLARTYLKTMDALRDARTAIAVAERLGNDARDMRHHAAQLQVQHEDAFNAMVRGAVQWHEDAQARATA